MLNKSFSPSYGRWQHGVNSQSPVRVKSNIVSDCRANRLVTFEEIGCHSLEATIYPNILRYGRCDLSVLAIDVIVV